MTSTSSPTTVHLPLLSPSLHVHEQAIATDLDDHLSRPTVSDRPSLPGRNKTDSVLCSTATTVMTDDQPLPSPQAEPLLWPRPRNRSPYARGHLRSQSAATAAPPMARTRSLPAVHTTRFPSPSHSPRSSSPLRSSASAARGSTPRKQLFEDIPQRSSSPSFGGDIEVIAEDEALDITPRAGGVPLLPSERELQSPAILLSSSFTPSYTLTSTGSGSIVPPRSSSTSSLGASNSARRRPTSPLHQSSYGGSTVQSPTTSPGINVSRFNESFPTSSLAVSTSSTSIPSTPTSLRSRSPSISSLETIPDSPDAEEAAVKETASMRKLRIAAASSSSSSAVDSGEDSDGDSSGNEKRRSNFGVWSASAAGASRHMGTDASKRKRWSVCGAERRGDFEMETIWED